VNLLEALRLAAATLWANRLRTFLTILGNMVAVSSVVAVVAVINGLNSYVSQQILSTGSHVFSINKIGLVTDYDTWMKMLRRKDLTLEDADALSRQMQNASAVVPMVSRSEVLRHGRDEANGATIVGLGDGYPELRTLDLETGRHLSRQDILGRTQAAVIGVEVRDKLFGSTDPIGMDFKIGGYRFQIVGVLKKRGSVLGQSQDNVVLVPVTTYQKLFGKKGGVELNIRSTSSESMEAAQEEAALILKLRRGLKPWDEPDFSVQTSEMLYSLYQNITKGIYGLTVGIVAVSLLVGGIVIMNIMFVSVTERTREIGIRRALGAKRRDVVMQFLSESVALAALGGVFGVMIGVAGAMILRATTPLPAAIQAWSIIVGLLLASSVGLFFGIYPAFRASRLVPVEALRHEV
jgi:putative ABC transport system permease protein